MTARGMYFRKLRLEEYMAPSSLCLYQYPPEVSLCSRNRISPFSTIVADVSSQFSTSQRCNMIVLAARLMGTLFGLQIVLSMHKKMVIHLSTKQSKKKICVTCTTTRFLPSISFEGQRKLILHRARCLLFSLHSLAIAKKLV